MNIHKLAGTKIEDKWTIDSYIAKGGQGVVYKAREIATGDLYAVKVFDSFERVTLEKRKRIVNEINVLSKLQESKYIVKTFGNNISADTESKIGFTYYVMDFAKYGSLKDNNYYLGDVEVCLRLFKQILLGVKEAHSKSIIHRDLKPENILFFPTQKDIVISDFGLGLLKDISTDERVTQEDEFLGPMFFISPEQYKSPSDVDERSDIYSLGKILYFMLTGQGKTFREQVESLASVFVGKSIFIPLVQQNLIEKMIVEDKNKRFSNVGEAIDAVEAILQSMDSTNVNRFLVQKNDQPKFDIYKFLLTGDERNKFINDFPKNIDRSLVELEYIAKDLLKKGKVQTLDELYKDLFEKHKRGIGKIAIHCVKSFVANPKELLELCKTYKNQALPKYYLSRYYNKLRTYSNAHKLMLDAIESESTKDLKLTYVLELIDICKNCKCSLDHSPSNQLQKLIEESSNKREKIELYKILGNHLLEKGKDNLLGLKFLEAYLDEHPDDSDIRFKCAYEYSKIKEYGLALFHYNSYLDLNEYDSYALNNIGHIYDTKAMPIKAMKTYRQAYDLGNTLSGSNIALKYLEIGLIKEADKLLKDIIKNNDRLSNSEKLIKNIIHNITADGYKIVYHQKSR